MFAFSQTILANKLINNAICKPYVRDMERRRRRHTIIGAGQVGMHLARHLGQQGERVRLVRRSAPGPSLPGVTWMQGDITDRAFADEACRGADVVYNCTNPSDYARWVGILEPLYRSTWDAASRAGARLVQLDNLYMVGRPPSAPFDEQAPMQPCSKKGELRKVLAEELMARHAAGDLEVAVGRASDYFGPETPNAAVLRPDVYDRIVRGSSVFVFGNPDMPHSYSYTPDVAAGLATLGRRQEAAGRVWHLPVAAQLTTRELIGRFAAHAGTEVTVRAVPTWALHLAGYLFPLASAIEEMLYQWEEPFSVDDERFRATFGTSPTPLDEAIAATLDAHRQVRAA